MPEGQVRVRMRLEHSSDGCADTAYRSLRTRWYIRAMPRALSAFALPVAGYRTTLCAAAGLAVSAAGGVAGTVERMSVNTSSAIQPVEHT